MGNKLAGNKDNTNNINQNQQQPDNSVVENPCAKELEAFLQCTTYNHQDLGACQELNDVLARCQQMFSRSRNT